MLWVGDQLGIPHTAKGHGEVMETSFFGCDLRMLENL